MKHKKQKTTTADQLWSEAIKPIIDYCAKTHGAKTKILNLMNDLFPPQAGLTWNRQQVEAYLRADATKRLQPRLGAGLALIAAAGLVMMSDGVMDRLKTK